MKISIRRIDRILRESESLAFAGLLFDVGKYRPHLFAGVLKPLLQNWLLLDWDRQTSTLRRSGGLDPIGLWAYQPRAMIELGRAWYQMPHRKDMLLYIGGGIVDTLVADEAQRSFLAQLRSGWVSEFDGEEPPESLRLLSERLNPDNYTFETRDGKRVAVSFDWSEAVKQKNQEDLQRIATDQTVTSFPSNAGKCSIPMNAFLRISFLSSGSSCRVLKASRRGLPVTAIRCFTPKTCSAVPSPC